MSTIGKAGQFVFFLGGHDLEMETIAALVSRAGRTLHDKGLGWNMAVASAYRSELEAALAAGMTPVLVELRDDIGLPQSRIHLVDHHGVRAGANAPTSLHQVFALLQLPVENWTRRYELVAANDRGHIDEMVAMGASAEEMREIRAADRRAQGVGPDEEATAAAAVANAEILNSGLLTAVRLPHRKTSTVADRMHSTLGGPGFRNLLVISPGEVNFFGEGKWIRDLDKRFPGGWVGGALPARGFWGSGQTNGDGVLSWLLEQEKGSA